MVTPRQVRRGREFEELLFGFRVPNLSPPAAGPYLDGLRHCLLCQPSHWDPFNPPVRLSWTLRYWVAKCLPARLEKQLGLYVSLGTALDYWHGVDCFFYLGNPLVDEDWCEFHRRVTIDVASYDKHRAGLETSANLLITPETFYCHRLKEIGRCVAGYLTGKIGVRGLQTPFTWVGP